MRTRFIKDDTQLELFAIGANSSDIRSKQVKDFMSWGMFNISTQHKLGLRHEQGEIFVDVKAGQGKSIASYHDNDILIFLTSHLVAARNEGVDISPRIFFTANEYFKFAGRRHIGGARYDQIWAALYRLQDTFVHTNIDIAGGNTLESRWNWLPEINRVKSRSGKSLGFECVVADPIYKAVAAATPQVLTLDRRYFDFRSGFQKWLYLYARKSAGTDGRAWIATEQMLHSRSGSSLPLTQFRKMLKAVVDTGELGDYSLTHARHGRDRAVAFSRKKQALAKVHKTTIIMD